jgi:hypothetical protein
MKLIPILLAIMNAAACAAEKIPLPTVHTTRNIEGWTSVLTTSGKMRAHYGLTDPKEFFAEMTECYFGSNDFKPFVSGELKQAEPETSARLAGIWGPLPGSAPSKAAARK